MDEELRGYKQGKLDLLDSYNQFYLQKKRLTRDAKQMTCSGVRPSKLSAGMNSDHLNKGMFTCILRVNKTLNKINFAASIIIPPNK